MQEPLQAIQTKSHINYGYITIKMTQSRIDKGLIAIPVSLTKWFPKSNGTIHVYLDDSPILQPKAFSAYGSSTNECRIGGMREWLEKNKIKNGDEIVIQVIDDRNFIYRLIFEGRFIAKTQELQSDFDNSKNEQEASENIKSLAQWTHVDKEKAVLNEYKRLISAMPMQEREYSEAHLSRGREKVPASLRTLLEDIYKGHCQVCDFWFLKRDSKPYFEIHHLDPLKGHYPKNLVAVCGNCHNQFEYVNVHYEFNNDGWIVKVMFNERTYSVKQIAVCIRLEDSIKELFI